MYFHDYKLVIKIDENGHSDRNTDMYIKRQKAIEQELGCIFIRIDPDQEDFDTFKVGNEIFRQIKQSTKETLISKIRVRLLEFDSDNIIKSKATNFILMQNIAWL